MPTYPAVAEIRPVEGPLDAVVRPPGSKSITNRALVVAALASGGASRLEGPLEADDTAAMRDGLRRLGVLIDDVDEPWLVLGTGGELSAPARIDARASGTTGRFLAAVGALAPGQVEIDGTPRMRQRPFGELVDALRQLGAHVEAEGGAPPIRIEGGTLHGGRVVVDGRRSSQFVSALLMIGPLLPGGLQLELVDGELVSRPYVDGTIEVMTAFGASVDVNPGGFEVAESGYLKTQFEVEADASAAAYPLVAAAVVGGSVSIEGIPPASIQPDLALVSVLERMGCAVDRPHHRLRVTGPVDRLRAVDVDMNAAPDAVLALAVACLFADGPSRIRNVGNLRLKETDRLAALQTEIRRLGAAAEIEGDDLVVIPGRLSAAQVQTYDDHRMAMAFSLVGLRQPGIRIDDPACVAKTWPGFFDMLGSL